MRTIPNKSMLRKAAQEESAKPGVLGQAMHIDAMAKQPRGMLCES
jgi:hypothetical protein